MPSAKQRFRKGDTLAVRRGLGLLRPTARVERVSGNIVYCVNLVPCETMQVGDTFSFNLDDRQHGCQYCVVSPPPKGVSRAK